MLHIDKRCGLKKAEVNDKKQVLLRMTGTKLGGADQLYPRATIDALPNHVLLEFYLGKDDANEFDYLHNYDRWQTLVHVCCTW
jgi:hypothetical protein